MILIVVSVVNVIVCTNFWILFSKCRRCFSNRSCWPMSYDVFYICSCTFLVNYFGVISHGLNPFALSPRRKQYVITLRSKYTAVYRACLYSKQYFVRSELCKSLLYFWWNRVVLLNLCLHNHFICFAGFPCCSTLFNFYTF